VRGVLSIGLIFLAGVSTSCPRSDLFRATPDRLVLVEGIPRVDANSMVAPEDDDASDAREAEAARDDARDWGLDDTPNVEENTTEAGDDAEPLEAVDPPAVDPHAPKLASIARETWVYAEPRYRSRRLGYLRAGAIVTRGERAAGTRSCKAGWYAIEPAGFVCAQKTATLDLAAPVVAASARRPRMDGLPYDYVMSRFPTPPFYARVPTRDEQLRAEPDLASHQRKVTTLSRDKDFVEPPPPETLPASLVEGRVLPSFGGDPPRSPDRAWLGQARTRSGFALLSQFEHEGRRFGLTTDLFLIPIDRTRYVRPSSFRGVALNDTQTLPVAFVMKKRATRYTPDEHGRMKAGDVLSYREALSLSGNVSLGGAFLEVRDGTWVRAEDVRRIDRMTRPPLWSSKGRKWIDVSILKQSLVAYEGDKPVYVTLVSTGADGLGDPKKTHSTIQGAFLIHTKHVSVTMDADEKEGDPFDLRDVPFVQYFTEGYALHAAYWHDDFGTPRSHGCINLAPTDAAWLFEFTTPDVPENWHAAMSLKKGTLVHTHP
jgi:hypothetical protein